MSEFHVEVIQIAAVGKHPNADTLSITTVHGGYPVILRTGEFKEGDRAVYVPVDGLVPLSEDRWKFLKKDEGDTRQYHRIKAKKLRGIFSMGILTQADPSWELGQNVQEQLKILKWEPALDPVSTGGEAEKDPGFMPCYTDLDSLRKYKNIIEPGEEVVVTEKIHGANGRWLFHEDRLWVGSHNQIKRENSTNMWWRVAAKYNLQEKLSHYPGFVFYGEVYGQVQNGFNYDIPHGEVGIRIFDTYDAITGKYMDWKDTVHMCECLGLPIVPVLYQGPWDMDKLLSLSNGKTTIGDSRCREGFVVKPVKERWHPRLGRVILKMVGEDYLLKSE